MARRSVNTLMAQIMQPNLPEFMPTSDGPQFHLATILGHDSGKNESGVTLNDFDGTPVYKLPVLRPYPIGVDPQQDHLVQLVQLGNTLMVLGRQYRPTGLVTFP